MVTDGTSCLGYCLFALLEFFPSRSVSIKHLCIGNERPTSPDVVLLLLFEVRELIGSGCCNRFGVFGVESKRLTGLIAQSLH
jgi:hypothetical protein